MTTYVLLMVLTFFPNGSDKWVIDYNLTREDCVEMLAEAPKTYEHGNVTVSYACEVE